MRKTRSPAAARGRVAGLRPDDEGCRDDRGVDCELHRFAHEAIDLQDGLGSGICHTLGRNRVSRPMSTQRYYENNGALAATRRAEIYDTAVLTVSASMNRARSPPFRLLVSKIIRVLDD